MSYQVPADDASEETLDCPTCDGSGQAMMRGETHRGYDDPDYMDTCGICGGSGQLPRSMFSDADDYEPDPIDLQDEARGDLTPGSDK